MKRLTPDDDARLFRRRRKMASTLQEMVGMLQTSINTGAPCCTTSRFQSLLGHFEADRIRIADIMRDDVAIVDAAVAAATRRSPVDMSRPDWEDIMRNVLLDLGVIT
jgi:hypothetical protein